ncbi:EipA family protein, partial [Lysobacter sp. TAB13]
MDLTRRSLLAGAVVSATLGLSSLPVLAQSQNPQSFSQTELVSSGHQFFGNVSRGLALTIEEAVRRWGEPNGYVLGQEASGAFVGGLRFGEGTLFTRNAGDRKVFW